MKTRDTQALALVLQAIATLRKLSLRPNAEKQNLRSTSLQGLASSKSGATLAEVQKQARFLVQTDVHPKLAELDAVIQNPHKHWYRRAVDLAKAAPELAANFATLPVGLAIAKVLAKIAGVFADVRDEQLSREKQVASTGLYYLLKLKAAAREPSAAGTVS